LLIEDLIKNANAKQRKRIESVISQLDKAKEKTALHKRIERLMTKRR